METIAGYRVSKLSVRSVGDDKLPLSVHTVMSSDDLLTEILVRLPGISLVLFKSVSKRWLSLIKHTNFIKRRGLILNNIDPPCGIFLRHFFNINLPDLTKYDFVPFDVRIPDSVCGSVITFKLGPETASNVSPFVMQSCNGLLLCRVKPDKYYVYNPSIHSFKLLHEPITIPLSKVIFDMKIAFDPTKSPHYTLVHVRTIGEKDAAMSLQVQTYSSQTGVWSVVCDDTFPTRGVSGYVFSGFDHGLCWNDAIHWLTKFGRGALHYKLDFLNKHPTVTNIRLPILNKKDALDRKLFESRGCLLLLGMDYTHSHQLNVYEMRNGSSEWLFKYFVNLDDIMSPFPTKWLLCDNIWCIALGETEDDSFMVIRFNNKALLYKIVSKTFRELPELKLLFLDSAYAGSFLFTPSFASV